MFIRRTQTRSRISGEPYVTYRLVNSARVGNAIKQSTVLNLGSRFDLPQAHWPALAQRIDELVRGQGSVLEGTLSEEVQAFAHRFAAQIIARKPAVPSLGAPDAVRAVAVAAVPATPVANLLSSQPSPASDVARYHEVDLDSLELVSGFVRRVQFFAAQCHTSASEPATLKGTRPKLRHQTLGTILKLEPNPGRTHRVLG